MSVLDDLIKVDKNGRIYFNSWIEWVHPATFTYGRAQNHAGSMLLVFRHCPRCLALNGCYFIKTNMPPHPLHPHCDCKIIDIDYSLVIQQAKAECKIEKFTKYIFTDEKQSKGKNVIFESLGYNIADSEYLREEFCKQALDNYLSGNYTLKNLDDKGQRISIPITLNHVTFDSGWLLFPKGRIVLTTPFGGWN